MKVPKILSKTPGFVRQQGIPYLLIMVVLGLHLFLQGGLGYSLFSAHKATSTSSVEKNLALLTNPDSVSSTIVIKKSTEQSPSITSTTSPTGQTTSQVVKPSGTSITTTSSSTISPTTTISTPTVGPSPTGGTVGRIAIKHIDGTGKSFESKTTILNVSTNIGGSENGSGSTGTYSSGFYRISTNDDSWAIESFSYCTTSNCTPSQAYVQGSSVDATLAANGYISIVFKHYVTSTPTPTATTTTGTLMGYYLNADYGLLSLPGMKITIARDHEFSDIVFTTTDSSYWQAKLEAGFYYIKAEKLNGYTISSSLCPNCLSFIQYPYNNLPEGWFGLQVVANYSYGIYIKYTPQ